MLTIQALESIGVNTKEGLARCMNNEGFYLRLVGKALDDKNFGLLDKALEEGNLDNAFEAAHALKGSIGNLSLTPIYEPIAKMSDLLKARTQMDYTPYLDAVHKGAEDIRALM